MEKKRIPTKNKDGFHPFKKHPKKRNSKKSKFFSLPFISLVRPRMRGYKVTEDPKEAEVILRR